MLFIKASHISETSTNLVFYCDFFYYVRPYVRKKTMST